MARIVTVLYSVREAVPTITIWSSILDSPLFRLQLHPTLGQGRVQKLLDKPRKEFLLFQADSEVFGRGLQRCLSVPVTDKVSDLVVAQAPGSFLWRLAKHFRLELLVRASVWKIGLSWGRYG